jgi:hypothetical protein
MPIRFPFDILGGRSSSNLILCLKHTKVICKAIFIRLYVVPLLRTFLGMKGRVTVSRGFDTLLVRGTNIFVKLSFSSHQGIANEIQAYSFLSSKYPAIASLLPSYQSLCLPSISGICLELLLPINPVDALPHAVTIQALLAGISTAESRLTIDNCIEIKHGIQYIELILGPIISSRLLKYVCEVLNRTIYLTGLCHGDFHSRNIMLNEIGDPKIVDLDCFRLNGIRYFEALYFSLEATWSLTGSLWYLTLMDCIKGDTSSVDLYLSAFSLAWDRELGILFFLDRVGQEYSKYNIMYPPNACRSFVELLSSNHSGHPR